jgi:proteasome assembly chaperone (PAC2) family protein
MQSDGIHIQELPDLKNPLMIAGFDGWGNALKISSGMAAYLIRSFKAQQFAVVDPDTYYRYDELRPVVHIEDGVMQRFSPPEGAFYAARTAPDQPDLVILKADEPSLKWVGFVKEFYSLCDTLKVESVITMGSMYDHVLHTDRIISAIASNTAPSSLLQEKGVRSITYQGPSAIHSIIHSEGAERNVACMSLWCHCPYYLQGTTHFGILAGLGKLLGELGGFELDTEDLEASWDKLHVQIEQLIQNNAEIQAVVKQIRKAKVRGTAAEMKGTLESDPKIIDIQDFLQPK